MFSRFFLSDLYRCFFTLKNEAGGDEKRVFFFTWPYLNSFVPHIYTHIYFRLSELFRLNKELNISDLSLMTHLAVTHDL